MAITALALPAGATPKTTPDATSATTNTELVTVARVCQNSHLKNVGYAVRCYSISDQLYACINLGTEAGSLRDIERSGQKTYADMASEFNNEGGASVTNAINALHLTETAPANISSGQLVLDI